jgi:Dolichyl-phosphate-mannose-protein mannosyltransferase
VTAASAVLAPPRTERWPAPVPAVARRPALNPATLLLAVSLLSLMAVLLVRQAWGDSLTTDEGQHVQSGVCAWSAGIIDLEPSDPPGFKLLAGAGAILFAPQVGPGCPSRPVFWSTWQAQSIFAVPPATLRWVILGARLPMIGLALLLALTVFLWARALYGAAAGLLALAVAAVEPTLLAHGHLVTGDIGVSLGIVACLAAHWAWCSTHRRRWLVLAGLAFGWAMLNKASAFQLIPLVAAIEVVRSAGPLRRRLQAVLTTSATIGATGWALVCAVYLPFAHLFPQHHSWSAPLAWIAPPSWFYGVVSQLIHVHDGHLSYLNGQVNQQGAWYYYLEALALKTTVGLLVLALLAGLVALYRKDRISLLHIWLPIVAMVTTVTVAGIDIGIRYVLPVYPLMAIAAGGLIATRRPRLPVAWGIAAVCLLGTLISSLTHLPSHLGYFNELAGATPAQYLSDSNLDWGQDAWRLRDWWIAAGQPPMSYDYAGPLPLTWYGIAGQDVRPSQQPLDGLLAISVVKTTISVFGDDGPYPSLRSRTPVARIGSSIEIFRLHDERVSAQALAARSGPGPS